MEPEGSVQLQLDSILSHIFTSYFRSILILSFLLFLGFTSGLYDSGLLTDILYAYLISARCAACPIYPVFYIIALLIFHGNYKV
jgi:hypothetical protein